MTVDQEDHIASDKMEVIIHIKADELLLMHV